MSFQSSLQRNRLALEMAFFYLFFSSLLPIGKALKPYLGEAADVLQMASFFWPYPVFLALQSWSVTQALWPVVIVAGLLVVITQALWPVVIVAGLLVVIGFAWLLRIWFPVFAQPKSWAHISSVVLWYIPIFLVQGLFILTVWVLGYPIGE